MKKVRRCTVCRKLRRCTFKKIKGWEAQFTWVCDKCSRLVDWKK